MPAKKSATLPNPPSLWNTLGPSFILLGLALGSGELILWPYLAANYGLGLLWGALLGISFQYVLNTEVMRYSLAWGESVFVGFRKLSILLPIWYIFSTLIPWSLPGFSSAASSIIVHLFPQAPEQALSIGFLLLTGIILSTGSTLYKTVEFFQRSIIILSVPLLALFTFALSSQADWLAAAQGLVGIGTDFLFFPEGVALAAFLGAFAYSGAGGNLNLAQSYYIKEKGFGMGAFTESISSLFSGASKPTKLAGQTFKLTKTNTRRWNKWWKLVTTEHFIVFWLLGFVTIVLLSVMAQATVFGQEVGEGIFFLFAEGAVIGQELGASFRILYLLIAAVMLFSTQLGVLESSSRIISENILLTIHKPTAKVRAGNWFYAALWSQIILGIIVLLAGFTEPRLLLTLSAVLNAAAMMTSFVFIRILNAKRLPKELQPPLWRTAVLTAAALFFCFFLILTVRTQFGL